MIFSLLGIIPSLSGILSGLLSLGTMILSKLIDFVGWYLKEFWKGLGVIFHNLSVLTVILVVFIGGGWYFKTWDNDRVLSQCQQTCTTPLPQETVKKNTHPVKRYFNKTTTKYIPKVPQQRPPYLNPFGDQ